MNFGRGDVAILIAMSVAIMGMAFVMPALGLSSEKPSTPPQFDINSSRFDFTGDFPNNPGGPSQGTLYWVEQKESDSDNVRWLEGDTSGGVELATFTGTNEPTVVLNQWVSGDLGQNKTVNRSTEGYETLEITNTTPSWRVRVHFKDIEVINGSAGEYNYTVDYKVKERPTSDGGFISSMPIVGGIFSTGAKLAGVVGWIGSVIWWGFTFVFEIAINLIVMLFDIMVFLVGTAGWLTETYIGLMSSASGWAATILAIPSLIISFELAKLVMVGISLLPTT